MGKEIQRKSDLIAATLREIGAKGTLNVTVGQIAKRAGVSPGLAFHYFGDKEKLFLAAMRSILTGFRREVVEALKGASGSRARIEAVLQVSFAKSHFEEGAVAAWLNFYVLAQTSAEAQRLLTIYHRRFNSTLLHDLRPLAGARAEAAAERIAGLVDGLYLRFALDRTSVDSAPAIAQVMAALDIELSAK
ncbi:TetR/AcrR family transcriptional regulator, transcriptional repressor of bet genes [Roseivivax halotolerans]|jgi:TetR/AcrR family transcriptional repressor of bet genes|uniref:HTH-type transcriptional regulator BetI n=1 Tax=Roseivivax halotolerans TaxID=93684 RepID=A0A1I5X645_9RHOB|nr:MULTISPECIES: transcriptional regulator BetI [Roseivivax]QFT63473.1 HTH-type transcriptional regulator BetI [Roseivivax sp. THAF30]SFQ27469.1 TetR/AcrR family transcriptional regulator, transcriptional repressor of bet genes [Roseivivax halotolerans]